MKKIVAMMLLVFIVLAGCSSQSSEPVNVTSEDLDIQAIQKKGILNVGVKVDVPNFGYNDPDTNTIDGFEIDLARKMAEVILGDDSKVNLQGVTAKTRGPLLDNGELDMVIATFTITEERKLSYNFSDPYFIDGVGLLVKKDAGFSSLADLDGKTIGVAQSATTKDAIQAEAEAIGVKVDFAEFGSYPEIKAALDSGRIECFSVDTAILYGYLDDSTVILGDRFSPQEYGIASKLSNKALAKIINDTVNEMIASGEMDELISKWGLDQ
jgi:putative glutamine transport system substrate-binding protein